MNVYALNKLVRDKAIANMESGGARVNHHTLSTDDFVHELRVKLIEEALEIQNTSPDELPEELADMLELLACLAATCDLTLTDLDTLRQVKNAKRGSFEKRYYVSTIEVEPGSFWDKYCARDAKKYPRVNAA